MNSNLTLSYWDTPHDANITVTLSGIQLQTCYWNITDLNVQISNSFLQNTTLVIGKSTKNELLSAIVSNSTIKHLNGSHIHLKVEDTLMTKHRNTTVALFSVDSSKVSMINCTFRNIYAKGQYRYTTAVLKAVESLVEIHNSTFAFNFASLSNIFGNKSEILVTSSVFHDNTARYGGSIAAVESTVSVVESSFERNQARGGGAISVQHASSLMITSSLFEKNLATAGAAIHVTQSSLLKIVLSTLKGNLAVFGGGIIASKGSMMSAAECNFENNQASLGGAVNAETNSSMIVNDCTFKNNTGSGAGFNVSKEFKLDLLRLDMHGIWYGGAIYAHNEIVLVLVSCFFEDNSAARGGAIYAQDENA